MTDSSDKTYRNKRESMVKNQINGRNISSNRVLDVMRKIQRHLFVNSGDENSAYEDRPLGIGEQQTISQPYMVALMTELLELTGKERILEIGTGSGYQTAILAELGFHVWTIERFESLTKRAQKCLSNLGYTNISFKTGDGTSGWAEHSPFDRIIITAAAPRIPQILFQQLATDGIMVVPVGERRLQELKQIRKTKDNRMESINKGGCIFVPLVGEDGW